MGNNFQSFSSLDSIRIQIDEFAWHRKLLCAVHTKIINIFSFLSLTSFVFKAGHLHLWSRFKRSKSFLFLHFLSTSARLHLCDISSHLGFWWWRKKSRHNHLMWITFEHFHRANSCPYLVRNDLKYPFPSH